MEHPPGSSHPGGAGASGQEQGWWPLPRPLRCSSDASGRFEMSQDIALLLWHPLCQPICDSPWTQVQ